MSNISQLTAGGVTYDIQDTISGYTKNTGTVTSVTLKGTGPIAVDSESAITTSGTRTISHATSGATAGSYGDSAAQTPAYGGTFKVPYVTVNDTGHVTSISEHTVKIPASDNTNQKVKAGSVTFSANDEINIEAGSNVTVTGDATNKKITIASSYTNTNQTVKGAGTAFGANDAIDIVAGSNVTVTPDTTNKKITIAAADTHNSHAIISGVKADGSTNIQGSASSGNITLGDSGVTAGEYGPTAAASPAFGASFNVPDIKVNAKGVVTSVTNRAITLPAKPSDTNTAHSHTAGVGLGISGSGGTSGTTTYKAALADETLDTNAAITRPDANANRTYPVIADKNGKLATIVPWSDTDTHYTKTFTIQGNGTTATSFAQSANKTLNIVGAGAATVTAETDKITITATNTDTKVTAVGNHYTPSDGTALAPTSSGTATRGSTIVMTGITKDAAGHITGVTGYTLPASDNTTYSAGTGLSLSGTTFNHSNSVTAVTTAGLYKVKYDAQGHITGTTAVAKSDITALGIPGSDTDTKNTAGSTDTSSKIFLVGATSQAANPQTYSDNQVYATNGQLDANKVRVAEAVSLIYDSTNKCLNFTFA